MKSKIILFLICFTFCCSCKKKPFDYRNKYLGTWQFHVHKKSFNMIEGVTLSENYNYVGKIIYGSEKNEIKIICSDSENLQLPIDKNGVFKNLNHYSSAYFYKKDSININLSSGGLGGGGLFSISGKKINKKL